MGEKVGDVWDMGRWTKQAVVQIFVSLKAVHRLSLTREAHLLAHPPLFICLNRVKLG